MTTPKTITLGPFRGGMDNVREDTALFDKDDGPLLRNAVNVDITTRGRVQRRAGYVAAPGVQPKPLPPEGGAIEPGQLSCLHMGRRLTAVGKDLMFSDPWETSDTPSKNFIPFPDTITALASISSGVYVGADQTYFLPGDTASTELRSVLPSRIVTHSFSAIPREDKLVWMSEDGLVVGDQTGTATLLHAKHVEVGEISASDVGATLYRVQNGLRQIVGVLTGQQNLGVAAVGDYMDAEVVRKEISYEPPD